jgi:hypothetical protein
MSEKALRKIFKPIRDEATGGWRRLYIMRNFIICTPHKILLR